MKHPIQICTLFLLFVLLFSACQQTAPKDFVRDGISFNVPKDWKISEVDTADAEYTSISIDPIKEDGTSFIFIEWGVGLFDIDSQIKHVQSGYLEHPNYQQGNIEFTEIKKEKFANNEAVHSDFKFSITGIEQEGSLYCFQLEECNRTISIVLQNAAVDQKSLQEVLKSLEKSITCEK